jgi:hypothetical protein
MNENARAREPEEQAAMTGRLRELSLFTPWGGRRWREFAGAGCGGPGSAAAWSPSPQPPNPHTPDQARRPNQPGSAAAHPFGVSYIPVSYGHRREDWPEPPREPYEPAQGELGLLYSQVPGHRWNSWHRLTGDEDYYAACSCGWRSTETGQVSPMLRQVQDHLDAVRAVRGWRPASEAAQAPGRAGHERGAGQHEVRHGRTRELYAAAENQHRRLSQALAHSADLLSASEEQADRLVAALQHAAAGVAPEWARTEASVRRAEELQRRADRARQVHNHIVAAAGALTAIAEEVALLNQVRETGREKAVDWIYGERLLQPTEAQPSSGKAHDK